MPVIDLVPSIRAPKDAEWTSQTSCTSARPFLPPLPWHSSITEASWARRRRVCCCSANTVFYFEFCHDRLRPRRMPRVYLEYFVPERWPPWPYCSRRLTPKAPRHDGSALRTAERAPCTVPSTGTQREACGSGACMTGLSGPTTAQVACLTPWACIFYIRGARAGIEHRAFKPPLGTCGGARERERPLNIESPGNGRRDHLPGWGRQGRLYRA
mmetsp:Transcript_6555/g.21496  ORF Transcript_6555/g.21496 Transcript_6555/m.21496 type:complete len:213 (-) Transcript_6555:264-902(-)|eukprot:scaffold4328_cov135-Isochrysis_galbana.AAC.6